MGQEINWEGLARSEMHRLRIAILEHLRESGEASPNSMSRHLGEPLGNVSYHVKCLESAGLIHCARTEPRRGALEHFYQLTEKATQGG